MRCAQVDSLLEMYVDGSLEEARAALLSRHIQGCQRCQARLAAAQQLSAVLASPSFELKAPPGFSRKVMDEVFRQALEGRPDTVRPEGDPRRLGFYRRLGFSLVASAALLAASLLLPPASYPTLLKGGQSADMAETGTLMVKKVLAGARRIVQGTLGETFDDRKGIQGGDAK